MYGKTQDEMRQRIEMAAELDIPYVVFDCEEHYPNFVCAVPAAAARDLRADGRQDRGREPPHRAVHGRLRSWRPRAGPLGRGRGHARPDQAPRDRHRLAYLGRLRGAATPVGDAGDHRRRGALPDGAQEALPLLRLGHRPRLRAGQGRPRLRTGELQLPRPDGVLDWQVLLHDLAAVPATRAWRA